MESCPNYKSYSGESYGQLHNRIISSLSACMYFSHGTDNFFSLLCIQTSSWKENRSLVQTTRKGTNFVTVPCHSCCYFITHGTWFVLTGIFFFGINWYLFFSCHSFLWNWHNRDRPIIYSCTCMHEVKLFKMKTLNWMGFIESN